MNKTNKIKIFTSLAVLLINLLCTACVYAFDIRTTALKIIGSFASIIIVSVVVWIFPVRLYITALCFVVFASSLGSCVNLYQRIGFYDLFVHYLSGVLLFEGGRIIVEFLNKKRNLPDDRLSVGLFSLFFSCSCAAFWEIYEFTCDCLINANMQGTKENTMGDIIAGVLGAFTGLVAFFLLKKIKDKKRG